MLIVGDGETEYIETLKNLTSELGISHKVIFTGFIPKNELSKYFSCADIGVWPSNNSVIMIEAMACKLPLVIPDMQLGHLVSYDNGFTFPVSDMAAFQVALDKLITNPKLRTKMGRNSRKAAVENYSYKANAKALIEIYKKCINEKRRK